MPTGPAPRRAGAAALTLALTVPGATAHAQAVPPPPAAITTGAGTSANPDNAWPTGRRRSTAPRAEDAELPQAPAEAGRIRVDITVPGEWQVRLAALSSIPLSPSPGAAGPNALGQTWYVEQWFRFTPQISVQEKLKLVVQLDLARGILLEDAPTRQVELSRDARNTQLGPFPNGVVDLRWAYLDWRSPVGVVLLGQQGSHWGLGIVANDGNHPPLFGDYRMGDIVERVAFATRPLGENSDMVVALASDLVYRDRLARLYTYEVPVEAESTPRETATRTVGGDRAWQGILSVFYQDHACLAECDRKRVGLYAAYRDQTARDGGWLRIAVVDLYARWEGETPGGDALLFGAAELAGVFGSTTLSRSVAFPTQQVAQYGGAVEFGLQSNGRVRPGFFRLTLAGGVASGDANPSDGVQRAFTFNPDYRVGLILFPELLAWQTARAASIATDPRLVGRPTPGAELLPTSGGVSNAAYFNPTMLFNLTEWFDLRAGMVLAQATSDFVDPVAVTVQGEPRNYRGGSARARDLGLEFDMGAMVHVPLPTPDARPVGMQRARPGGEARRLVLTAGVQAGVAFPGHAFDDAGGRGIGPLGLVQGRVGVAY